MKRFEFIGAAALLLSFACLSFFSQRRNSITVDEFAHLPAGYYYWRSGDFSLYSKNPPLVKLITAIPLNFIRPQFERDLGRFPQTGWLPWFFANDFMHKNPADFIRIFEAGRDMTILLGVLLGIALYFAARSRYGPGGAMLSLAVFCFCPNIIAHSIMATVDIGASLFIFAAVISLAAYLKKPGWDRALIAGVCLGLAQLAKFSSLSLLVFYFFAPLFAVWPFKADRLKIRLIGIRCLQVLIMGLVWLVMVSAAYGFHGVFQKTADFKFSSRLMQKMQRIFSPLPAPFPEIYLKGVDGQLRDMQSGEFANYLMGNWYRGVSRKYLPIALLVKTPIALQILAMIALLLAIWPGKTRLKFEPDEAFILAVIVWLLLLFNFRNSLQIGIRYLLPVFPLGFLIIGRIGKAFKDARVYLKLMPVVLTIWIFGESIWIYPHYLSYFNEYVGGPKNGHKILLDSNLDWGQDLPALAEYMSKNSIDKIELDYFGHADPEIYGVNYQPLGQEPHLEYTAISAQLLFGGKKFFYPMLFHQPPVLVDPEKVIPYQRKKPVARAGYSIWIFKND